MKKLSRVLMEVIAMVLVTVSAFEIPFYGTMSLFKYRGYDNVCYNDYTLALETDYITDRFRVLSKVGKISSNMDKENIYCNFYDYDDYLKYVKGEKDTCDIKEEPLDKLISSTSSSYYELKKNDDGYYDLVKHVSGMLNIENGEKVEQFINPYAENYRFVFNKDCYKTYDFFKKSNNQYKSYEEHIANNGYSDNHMSSLILDEGIDDYYATSSFPFSR
ncbi:MAG: hypothetical protein K6G26_01525, partial [Lachnospiraceae bacterium]|nr:hypothetical protein [Lachnospiraceae bacterium]